MTDTNAVELEERTQNISVMSLTSSGRDSATILKIELEKTSPLATDDQDVLWGVIWKYSHLLLFIFI